MRKTTIRIRRLVGGDTVLDKPLEEARKEIQKAIKAGYLVVDDDTHKKLDVRNAKEIQDGARVLLMPPLEGG